jgi:hypothetical protein
MDFYYQSACDANTKKLSGTFRLYKTNTYFHSNSIWHKFHGKITKFLLQTVIQDLLDLMSLQKA